MDLDMLNVVFQRKSACGSMNGAIRDCPFPVNIAIFLRIPACLLEKAAAEMAALMARISSVWA